MSQSDIPPPNKGRAVALERPSIDARTPSKQPWSIRSPLASGGFMAHLLATRHDVPEIRIRRRADPQIAVAAYRDSYMPAARIGELLNQVA
jgi:hypothetical protein